MSQKKPVFTNGNKWFVAALNRLADALWRHGINPAGRPGWSETPDGWMPPLFSGSGSVDSFWTLSGSGDAFTITNQGRIYSSWSDASSVLTIEDDDLEFSLGSGKLVWIELTFNETTGAPILTLKAGDAPEEWPIAYQFAEAPEPPRVIKAYFELYEGKSGTIPEGEYGTQYEGFWVRKSFRHADSVLSWGSYELDEEFTGVPIPILMPR